MQVCWEKFARYWDIELRQVPMEPGRLAITPEAMLPYLDENTIGVVTTLGLTFTGAYEPVEAHLPGPGSGPAGEGVGPVPSMWTGPPGLGL